MRDVVAISVWVVAVVFVGCGFAWAIQGNDFLLYRFFAPKYEAVRRDVMIESRAYSEATTRRLYDLRRQLVQAKSEDEKAAVRAMALHEVHAFDAGKLPIDLRLFVEQLKR